MTRREKLHQQVVHAMARRDWWFCRWEQEVKDHIAAVETLRQIRHHIRDRQALAPDGQIHDVYTELLDDIDELIDARHPHRMIP